MRYVEIGQVHCICHIAERTFTRYGMPMPNAHLLDSGAGIDIPGTMPVMLVDYGRGDDCAIVLNHNGQLCSINFNSGTAWDTIPV